MFEDLYIPPIFLIAFFLNCFSYEVIEPPDGSWGTRRRLENGTQVWTGMVRQLVNGEADLCGASLTITEERSRVIDFSIGVIEDIVSIGMLDPRVSGLQHSEVHLMVFLTVFDSATWIGIIASTVLAGFAFAVVWMSEGEEDRGEKTGKTRAAAKFVALGLCGVCLSLVQRNPSSGENERFLAAKMLLLTTSALSLVLFSYYGGNLTATMTVGFPRTGLRSFRDVLDSRYGFYLKNGTVYYDMFQHAEEGSPMRRLMDTKARVSTDDEFFLAQQESPSHSVYFGSQFSFIKNEGTLFIQDFDDALVGQLAFAFRKNSDFADLFSYHLVKLFQTGTVDKVSHRWMGGDRPGDWSGRIFQEVPSVLGYENLFFPIIVIIAGTVSALLLLLLENLILCKGRMVSDRKGLMNS